MPDTHSRRRNKRVSVILRATCRTLSGYREDVILSDITAEGCRVHTRGMNLRASQLIIIRPEAFEGIPGRIRWVSSHEVGVEFERPLYGPVAEHLQRKHGSSSPAEFLRSYEGRRSVL